MKPVCKFCYEKFPGELKKRLKKAYDEQSKKQREQRIYRGTKEADRSGTVYHTHSAMDHFYVQVYVQINSFNWFILRLVMFDKTQTHTGQFGRLINIISQNCAQANIIPF